LRLAAVCSGGKDSTYALAKALEMGHELACMLTVLPENPWSYMFHSANVSWVGLQAKALGLPLISAPTKGEKEVELQDLGRALALAKQRFGIEGIVSGAIASVYQKSRLERLCEELGLRLLAPLWGRDQEELLDEYVASGLDAIFVSVSALGLDQAWLGRRLDGQAAKELKALHRRYGLNPCGEGGEYETFVLWAPPFRGRIEITKARSEWHGDWGIYIIEGARLLRRGR
jgi:diphthine-ammonia ligase